VVVVDMEAVIEHLSRGTARYVDKLIIVVEPGRRSIETALTINKLAQDIGLQVLGFIPQDPDIAYCDLVGKPMTELTESPGLEAIRDIVRKSVFAERFGQGSPS